jgi:hypothetical protein
MATREQGYVVQVHILKRPDMLKDCSKEWIPTRMSVIEKYNVFKIWENRYDNGCKGIPAAVLSSVKPLLVIYTFAS